MSLLCCTTSQTGQIRAVFCAVFSTYQQPKSHPAIGVPPLMEPPHDSCRQVGDLFELQGAFYQVLHEPKAAW